MNRNLYRLKVEGRGSEVFQGHTVADSSFEALESLREHIVKMKDEGGGALTITVEMVGDALVLPRRDPAHTRPPATGIPESRQDP